MVLDKPVAKLPKKETREWYTCILSDFTVLDIDFLRWSVHFYRIILLLMLCVEIKKNRESGILPLGETRVGSFWYNLASINNKIISNLPMASSPGIRGKDSVYFVTQVHSYHLRVKTYNTSFKLLYRLYVYFSDSVLPNVKQSYILNLTLIYWWNTFEYVF